MEVGDRVVCIKGFDSDGVYPGRIPKKDEKFTIRGIHVERIMGRSMMYLALDEITEFGVMFRHDHFRKWEEDFAGGVLKKVQEEIEEEELVTI